MRGPNIHLYLLDEDALIPYLFLSICLKIDLDEGREGEREKMYNRAFWEGSSEIISIAGCVAQLSPEIEKTSGSMLSSVCPSVLAKAHNVCLWHPKDPSLWIISVLVPEEINSPSRLISGGKK